MNNQENIVFKGRYCKNNYALLKCKTCKHCFSETRGTIFFGLDTSKEEVLRAWALLSEKGSIRGFARATGHSKDTICKWIEIAGTHPKEVIDYFLQDLNLNIIEVDEHPKEVIDYFLQDFNLNIIEVDEIWSYNKLIPKSILFAYQ